MIGSIKQTNFQNNNDFDNQIRGKNGELFFCSLKSYLKLFFWENKLKASHKLYLVVLNFNCI